MVDAGTRVEQFRTDCAAMVDHFAQLATHPLVYLALPPTAYNNSYQISGTVIHDQIVPILEQVAAAKGIPTIDVNTTTAGHPELFPDGVHPNDDGYKLVAQVMYAGLLSPGDGGFGGGGRRRRRSQRWRGRWRRCRGRRGCRGHDGRRRGWRDHCPIWQPRGRWSAPRQCRCWRCREWHKRRDEF